MAIMHLLHWLAKGVDKKVVVFAPESPFPYLYFNVLSLMEFKVGIKYPCDDRH